MEERQNSTCPYCAESIMPDAIKCKHCGEWLQSKSVADDLRPKATQGATMQCKKCSNIVPITWESTFTAIRNAKCPSCGNSPYQLPIVQQILIGIIIGPIIGYLVYKILGLIFG